MFFNHSLEITAFNQVQYPAVEITRSKLQKPRLQLRPAVCLFKRFGASCAKFCAIH